MERVADYVMKRLVERGVGHIFLITGRGVLYLTDAVAKNQQVTGVSAYHEQGASYAAMAYAAAGEGMGACLVSTGCAAANAITAALCAYQDNLPVMFISGQNMLRETTGYTGLPIRTYGSQQADIVSIAASVTKYAVMLTEAKDIRKELDKAFYFANEGRKGPVWIDIPLDLQNARIDPEGLEGWDGPEERADVDCRAVERLADELQRARRPILYLGGGVRSSGAQEEVVRFIEDHGFPVVFSPSAADVYGTANRLSVGAVGSLGGSRAGNMAVQNADLVLVLGSKLCSQTTGQPDQFARGAKVFAVDIDPAEHKKEGVAIDELILSDIRVFIDRLSRYPVKQADESWVCKCLEWKEMFSIQNEGFVKDYLQEGQIDLYHFSDTLSEILPADATVITDAGFEELIIPSSVRYGRGQRCLFPTNQGAMGYAIPAVLGAHYAGKRHIAVVVGDGSLMMNVQELLAIAGNHIPAKIFVINNNMYAVIRKRQQDLFRNRTIGNDPSDGLAAPDIQKIAECFGFAYKKVDRPGGLADGLKSVLEMDGACICEVVCAEKQKYLHTSFAINEARKLVKRPLEDLSPFISREVFLREMIVEPIQE